jgi:hypothetical protein
MTASCNDVCIPRAFTLFDSCGGLKPGYAVNDWEISEPDRDGRVTIKLDNGYTLELDETRSSITIIDSCGTRTKIWGDPHVDQNNLGNGTNGFQNDWIFNGTATFVLKDHTKITINTVAWEGNRSMDLAENVVVTKGEKSLVIAGLSQNGLQAGGARDLSITKGMHGGALDVEVDDGAVVVREGDNGAWLDVKTGLQIDTARAAALYAEEGRQRPDQPSVCEQVKIAHKCVETYCFTWLEAMAAAFGNVLVKQVDKMNYIYKNLNACYAISANKECSDEVYKDFCKAREAMGGTGDPAGWTSRVVDGKTLWTPSQAAAEEAGKGQVFWQQVLTGAAQQFQLSAQTGMTVQNAVSQGLQTVSRGS